MIEYSNYFLKMNFSRLSLQALFRNRLESTNSKELFPNEKLINLMISSFRSLVMQSNLV